MADREKTGGARVSVILVVRDQARMLLRCLTGLSRLPDSLSFEVVVLDNGSRDDTERILGAVDGDLLTLRRQPPIARGQACDEAVSLANGEYLCFLREDAVGVDGWLETLADGLERDPELGAVIARTADLSGRTLADDQWVALLARRVAFDQVGGFGGSARPLRWEGATLLERLVQHGWRTRTEQASVVLLAPEN